MRNAPAYGGRDVGLCHYVVQIELGRERDADFELAVGCLRETRNSGPIVWRG